jgi:dCMP deaminase
MNFHQLKWDKRFLKLAEHIAQWSRDPSTKVGAVLVEPGTNLVLGLGYNGFARGVEDTEERYADRELKYKFMVHAEINAILAAGSKARGTRLYVFPSFMPPPICNECCKVAMQAGVSEIVGYVANESDTRAQRWAESIKISKLMCDEAGITYRGIPLPV